MSRPKLLDLYCKAGGAAAGYEEAGFDVLGVDIEPQPRYPYPMLQADVLSLGPKFLDYFDAFHASPPCQFGTELRHAPNAKDHHLNLIPQTRAMLLATGKPYVIENVRAVRHHLIDPVCLCGSMFGMGVSTSSGTYYQLQRHRLFETNWGMTAPCACMHTSPVIGVYGGHVRCRSAKFGGRLTKDFEGEDKPAMAGYAMEIDWMTMGELSEAVPPVYTNHIGQQLLEGMP